MCMSLSLSLLLSCCCLDSWLICMLICVSVAIKTVYFFANWQTLFLYNNPHVCSPFRPLHRATAAPTSSTITVSFFFCFFSCILELELKPGLLDCLFCFYYLFNVQWYDASPSEGSKCKLLLKWSSWTVRSLGLCHIFSLGWNSMARTLNYLRATI